LIDFGLAYGVALALREKYWPAAVWLTLLGVVPTLATFPAAFGISIPLAIGGLGVAGLLRAVRAEPR
jgi:hypothetical protein